MSIFQEKISRSQHQENLKFKLSCQIQMLPHPSVYQSLDTRNIIFCGLCFPDRVHLPRYAMIFMYQVIKIGDLAPV